MAAFDTMKTVLLMAAILLGLAVQCPALTGEIAAAPNPSAARSEATPG